MKKVILIVVAFLISIFLFSCQNNTTENTISSEIENPSVPIVEFSDYSLEYFVVRNKDENGRTISLDYFYDNLNQILTQVNLILSELPDVTFNGGFGPLSGRYDDGWVVLSSSDDSSIMLYFYLMDDYTILGLKCDDSDFEFYYEGLFDTEILAIFDSIST
jgi:hypothetical protein